MQKPNVTNFNPLIIKSQKEALCLLRRDWDYNNGLVELLLSGSYGSAKSIFMAHMGVTHCLMNKRARVCIARRAMPDLKNSIFNEIMEHIDDTGLREGKDYVVSRNRGYIRFANGSEVISQYWADKKYKRGRSLKLSMLIVEELTENSYEDMDAYYTLYARVGRIPWVKENIVISATNPDGPSNCWYKYWFEFDKEKIKNRFVIKSVTFDNPFLPATYIETIMRTLDPKSVRRYIYGEWVELAAEGVYYNYNHEINFKNEVYQIDMRYPIYITHDFNIGDKKPMSCALGQFINNVWHWFSEVHIDKASTEQIYEDLAARGLLDYPTRYIIHGDASGKAQSSKSIRSDYDIIRNFLNNYRTKRNTVMSFDILVPQSNPPVRSRHNLLNAYFQNALKEVRFYVYKGAEWIDQGLRLTKLKKGGEYIEDDGPSSPWQHVTTAIGYAVVYQDQNKNIKKIEVI